MVLSCIDPRFQSIVYNYLKKKRLNGKYSSFTIAGSAIGVTAPKFRKWHKTFWDNLETSIKLHKIKKLNAFIACSHPGNSHSPTFMICRKCEKVAEIDEKKSGLKLDKKSLSEFKIEESIIEIIGICKKCIRGCNGEK